MRYVGALAVVGSLAAGVWVVSQPPPPATTGELQIPKQSTPQACSAGREARMYYDLDTDLPYYCDDTNWVTFGATISGTYPYIPRFNSAGTNIENSDDLRNAGTPAAGADGTILQLADILNAMDGSDTVRGFYVNLTNAAHTGSGNILRGISIAGITSVSTAQEIALYIGDGWEEAIVTDGFVVSGPPGAASSGQVARVGWTLAAMDGSDTVRALYINPTNADHTGSGNVFYGISLGSITGDAEANETAIHLGTGWDNAIALSSSLLTVRGSHVAANGNAVVLGGMLPALSSGAYEVLDFDIGNANHSGGTVIGIGLGGISTPDADAAERAIQIGGSAGGNAWDQDIYFTTSGVLGTHSHFFNENTDGHFVFDTTDSDPNYIFGAGGTAQVVFQGSKEITSLMGTDLDLSGTTLTIDPNANVVEISGDGADTVSIITAPTTASHTERVTLICSDADVTFNDADAAGAAGTLDLLGTAVGFVCSADDSLTLVYLAAPKAGNARWIEVSRSVN